MVDQIMTTKSGTTASPWRCALIALALVGAACGGEEAATESTEPAETESTETSGTTAENESPENEPSEAEAPPADGRGVDEAAQPRAEAEAFVLELRPAEGYQAGQLGQFALHLEGQGEWHLNQDFPFSAEVARGDSLTLPKTRFAKADAESFADEAAVVSVPFTAGAAGDHAVSVEVAFAMCNPESCVPHTATVGARLTVTE